MALVRQTYFGHVFRQNRAPMTFRIPFLAIFALAALATGVSAQQTALTSPHGKANQRDPLFLRFADMAERYWVNTETMAASHKAVAMPMPRQCAFTYADSYSRGQMSESEVQETALSTCNRRLAELGPTGENYNIACQCKLVVSDGVLMVPRDALPDEAYGPTSIFYRDDHGNVARLNGYARYGALAGRNRSVTMTVNNARGEQVCDGTLTSGGGASGNFALSCFGGKFAANGTYQSKSGAPNDHIVGQGQTGRGQPVVVVIGLPAQLAAGTYGGL